MEKEGEGDKSEEEKDKSEGEREREEEEEEEGKISEENSNVQMKGGTLPADESVWKGERTKTETDKNDEFEEYFRGMFL